MTELSDSKTSDNMFCSFDTGYQSDEQEDKQKLHTMACSRNRSTTSIFHYRIF